MFSYSIYHTQKSWGKCTFHCVCVHTQEKNLEKMSECLKPWLCCCCCCSTGRASAAWCRSCCSSDMVCKTTLCAVRRRRRRVWIARHIYPPPAQGECKAMILIKISAVFTLPPPLASCVCVETKKKVFLRSSHLFAYTLALPRSSRWFFLLLTEEVFLFIISDEGSSPLGLFLCKLSSLRRSSSSRKRCIWSIQARNTSAKKREIDSVVSTQRRTFLCFIVSNEFGRFYYVIRFGHFFNEGSRQAYVLRPLFVL